MAKSKQKFFLVTLLNTVDTAEEACKFLETCADEVKLVKGTQLEFQRAAITLVKPKVGRKAKSEKAPKAAKGAGA